MSASELGEWREYLRLDPRGEDSNAVLLAQLLSMYASAHSDPKSSRKPPTAEAFLADLYPDSRSPRDPANWSDEQRAVHIRYMNAKAKATSEALTRKERKHGDRR